MINWETGPDIYILLYIYIKQINNKDLLYSTENSTQYSVMAYMEKESKKGVCVCVCVCVSVCVHTDSLCCISETNTTLQVNDIPIKLI